MCGRLLFLLITLLSVTGAMGASRYTYPTTAASWPPAQAQPEEAIADSSTNLLTVGLLAGNNSYFFGRTTATQYPYIAADIIYKLKNGFWLSTTIYQIKNTKNYIDETDFMAGWDFDLTNRIDGSVSYARYIYGPDNPFIKSVVSDLATASVGLDWSYVYTKLTGSYIFGGTNDYFIGLNNSRYFEKANLLKAGDYLSVEPTINLLGGTQSFTRTYLTERLEEGKSSPAQNNGKGKGLGKGKGKGNDPDPQPIIISNTVTETKFTMLNYGFYLPLTYGFGSNSVELSWRWIKPLNVTENYSSQGSSIFTLSLYHSFKL